MTREATIVAGHGRRALSLRPVRSIASAAAVLATGYLVGSEVAKGKAPLLISGVVLIMVVAAVVMRPEAALMVWFAAILADGRWLTYHKVGPLYVTEPLLALLIFSVAIRLLLPEVGRVASASRQRPARFLLFLLIVMFVPATIGLATRTSAYDYATARNAVLILYFLFALIVVSVTDLRRSYRRWFVVALVGPTIALLLVVTGHAGPEQETSTGAIRVAAHTFALAFGIAPIVLIAAARERMIRPLYAFGGAVPFLVALVFVNHRSAWLALIASTVVLFGRRLSPPVIVGGLAIVVSGLILLSQTGSRDSVLSEEITRAKSVTSTTDPNAQFRLRFWKEAVAKSIDSPVIGAGFDAYPAEIVPPDTVGDDPFPAPHNSFVAIGYRIGFVPFLLVLAMLGHLIFLGFRASVERSDPRDRATLAALTAIVVYAGITSAFNVFLEAPYAGPLFWTAVGLLAYSVYARPFQDNADAAARR